MLVLARKINEKIVIGDNIVIQVLRKSRDVVKIGIQAPLSVSVHRQEIYEEIQRSHQAAACQGASPHEPLATDPEPVASSQAAELPADPVPTH